MCFGSKLKPLCSPGRKRVLEIKERERSILFSRASQEAQWWCQYLVSLQNPPLYLEIGGYENENHTCLLEAVESRFRAVCAESRVCVFNTLKLFSDFLYDVQIVRP